MMHNRKENEHYEASQGNKFLSAHSTNKMSLNLKFW